MSGTESERGFGDERDTRFGLNLRWLCPQVQHTHKGVYPTGNIGTSVSIAALYTVVNKYIVGTGLPVYEKRTR